MNFLIYILGRKLKDAEQELKKLRTEKDRRREGKTGTEAELGRVRQACYC